MSKISSTSLLTITQPIWNGSHCDISVLAKTDILVVRPNFFPTIEAEEQLSFDFVSKNKNGKLLTSFLCIAESTPRWYSEDQFMTVHGHV